MSDGVRAAGTKQRLFRGMKPFGGWLAGIVSAVVATVLATWLLAPKEEKSDPDAPPFTVAMRVIHGASNGEGWIVTHPLAETAPRPGWGSDDWNGWATGAGGIPHGKVTVNFTVQGRTQAQVTLTDLKVRVLNRRAAVAGVLFVEDGGGDGAFRAVGASLDNNPPKLTPLFVEEWIPDDAPPVERKPMTFPYKVSISDAETFAVEGQAKTCDCDWVIDLSWAAEGKIGTLTIDDNGKPFRVSGGAKVTQVCATGDSETCRPGPRL